MSAHPLARFQRQKEYMDRINGYSDRFARLNGWRYTDRSFTPETLRANSRKPDYNANYYNFILDHPLFFRDPKGYPVAIVGQPYGRETVAETIKSAKEFASALELIVHIPPNPRACFHAPGLCFFFVLTRSGQKVLWLPEQKFGGQ